MQGAVIRQGERCQTCCMNVELNDGDDRWYIYTIDVDSIQAVSIIHRPQYPRVSVLCCTALFDAPKCTR